MNVSNLMYQNFTSYGVYVLAVIINYNILLQLKTKEGL